MSGLVASWVRAFLLAAAVEGPVYALVCAPVVRPLRAGAVGVGATAVTLSLLWFAWPLVVRDYAWYAVTGEILYVDGGFHVVGV